MIPRRPLLLAALLAPAAARAAAASAEDSPAPGLTREVLIRWGDRVAYDAPPFDPAHPAPEAAAAQFGWDGRICALVTPPLAADGVPRAVLAVAHPTVDPAMAWPGPQDRPAVAAAMQGASLLNLERQGTRWVVVDGGYQSRRLDAGSLCRISGPVTGPVTGLGEAVQGVLGVSGGCATPWGSLLLTEDDPADWMLRLRDLGPRFAEPRRFGWVVELDPQDPASLPVKRTALARFAHGDAAAALSADGRAVVFLTDRRPGGSLYRFVSSGPATAADALDAGTLAVATRSETGIRWVPLPGGPEALLQPQAAASAAAAIGFDTPSGLALAGARLVLACRGGTGTPDALNPRTGDGHLVEIASGGDWASEGMPARVLLAGQGALVTPDTVTAGPDGGLWVGTDRQGRGGQADALFAVSAEGAARPVYTVPRGGSAGGAAVTADRGALLTIARTPGAGPGATWAHPGTRWPQFDPALPPRTTLVSLTGPRPW
ncbi:hypothetical protein C8P66_101408 [Humitalea rosea]|uniref:WD40 repeat protein n=1 Tax=Humitalea rosea TaxID=990373 RepID=A0A2W7ITM8_9PROT|nr:alkaline phosphatase PhoX [Humitalea rosea]PZW51186.1 hypothetical protein C8P66_101408 [Humitalea rosea]